MRLFSTSFVAGWRCSRAVLHLLLKTSSLTRPPVTKVIHACSLIDSTKGATYGLQTRQDGFRPGQPHYSCGIVLRPGQPRGAAPTVERNRPNGLSSVVHRRRVAGSQLPFSPSPPIIT